MELFLGKSLYVKSPTHEFAAFWKKELSLPNPLYQKMLKMGNTKALYATPQFFRYYHEDKKTGDLTLPRGIISRIENPYTDCRSFPQVSFPDKEITLRDYQLGIPEQILKHDQGIVRLGTGFGKSVIMLYLAQRLSTKTLILVPRSMLADQICQEAQKFLGITPDRLDKKWDTNSSPIHVCTYQTLQRKSQEQLYALKNKYGLVCVDESHLAVPYKTRKALTSFASKYWYGFTGTADRTDGQGEAIKFIFGRILVDEDLPHEKPQVKVIKTACNPFVFEYFELAESLAMDMARNQLIADTVRDEVAKGRKCLILTKRVEHYERIYQLLSAPDMPQMRAVQISSDMGAKDRLDLLERLRTANDSYDCLLGTYSLLATGMDIPSLDTVVFAGDLKSDVLNLQSIGRLLRVFEGKQHPLIIDIHDPHPILHRQFLCRKKLYMSKGWVLLS